MKKPKRILPGCFAGIPTATQACLTCARSRKRAAAVLDELHLCPKCSRPFRPACKSETAIALMSAPHAPHQSSARHVRFPGSTIAARDLGVSRAHLHRALTGERESVSLLARWGAWLRAHPEFARLQH